MVLKVKGILKKFFIYQGLKKGGAQGIAPVGGFNDHDISSHFVSGSPYPPSALPPMVCALRLLEISYISSGSFVLPVYSGIFFCSFRERVNLLESTVNQLIHLIIPMILM